MPITRGLKCAWCHTWCDNEYILELHERQHQSLRDNNKRIEDDHRNSKRRN